MRSREPLTETDPPKMAMAEIYPIDCTKARETALESRIANEIAEAADMPVLLNG